MCECQYDGMSVMAWLRVQKIHLTCVHSTIDLTYIIAIALSSAINRSQFVVSVVMSASAFSLKPKVFFFYPILSRVIMRIFHKVVTKNRNLTG